MGNSAGKVASRVAGIGAAPLTASFAYLGGAEAHGFKGGMSGARSVTTDPTAYFGSAQGRGQFAAGVATAAAVAGGVGAMAPEAGAYGGADASAYAASLEETAGGAGAVTGAGAGTVAAGGGNALAYTLAGTTAASLGASAISARQMRKNMPETPGAMPTTPQARDAVTSAGGYNMALSQQRAMSAGGTLFTTPSQWWNQNQQQYASRGGGSRLVGA